MPPPLEFLEDDKHALVLHHVAGATAAPADVAALVAAVAAAGYGDLLLDAPALEGAARRIGRGENFSVAVGCRTDAEYRVEIAPDKMAATLTVVAAHGGATAVVDGAAAALAGLGVVFGIDAAALAQALATPATPVVVARGVAPQPGVDGRLETLVEISQTRHPKEDDKGHTDFRELGFLRSVAAETPLLRRHPPQPGVPGHTVLGDEIAAAKFKDAKFAVRLQGVQVSPADPDLLVAAIAGQPVLHRDGISVDPVLVLNGVDLSTGNVDFVGTVEIKGDVQSGMKIRAGGDVVIRGTLESAEVDAGGEVEIKGGIIGQHGPSQGFGSDAKPSGARIHAKGNVRAHHVENATILAEQSVFVDESIVQSDITAMEQVVVGKEGGRKGHIIGGIVRATHAVTAYCIGAPGSNETRILVGMSPLLLAAVDEKMAAAATKLKEQGDLEKVVKVLETRPDKVEVLAKARLTLERTSEELAEIVADQSALEAELKLADHAEVVVRSAAHPGVSVTIGRKFKVIMEKVGAGAFRLVTDESSEREEEVVAFVR